jgi:hypothetical protein
MITTPLTKMRAVELSSRLEREQSRRAEYNRNRNHALAAEKPGVKLPLYVPKNGHSFKRFFHFSTRPTPGHEE